MTRISKKQAAIRDEYSQSPVVTEDQILNLMPPLEEPPVEDIQTFVSTTEPTAEEIAAALAEIDLAQEHATTAGVVDHESQISSWTPLEAAEETRLIREVEATIAIEEGNDQVADLDAQMARVSEDDTNVKVWRIRNSLDDRELFEERQAQIEADEKGKEPNANIFRTLKKLRTQLVTKRAARLLTAIKVEPDFINRSVNEGARYNVYALGKLGDVIYGVTDGVIANAINIACMRTLFEFKNTSYAFTMETAKAACSKQYAIKKFGAAIRQHIISHTVSESTAPTQASSTMSALTTLGVVTCDGAGKNPSYRLTDAPITRKLEAMLKAA